MQYGSAVYNEVKRALDLITDVSQELPESTPEEIMLKLDNAIELLAMTLSTLGELKEA